MQKKKQRCQGSIGFTLFFSFSLFHFQYTIDYDDYTEYWRMKQFFSFAHTHRGMLASVIIFNPFTSKDCQLSSCTRSLFFHILFACQYFPIQINTHFACGIFSLLQFLYDKGYALSERNYLDLERFCTRHGCKRIRQVTHFNEEYYFIIKKENYGK